MKTNCFLILLSFTLLAACNKEPYLSEEWCTLLSTNPSGRTYECAEVSSVNYNGNHCGLMPLNHKTAWVYVDSFFNENGQFTSSRLDTLQFEKTYQTNDRIVWWQPDKFIGLPEKTYTTEQTIYSLEEQIFANPCAQVAQSEFTIPLQDSSYISRFGDEAAIGKSYKLFTPVLTPLGSFTDCILFEKHAPGYRRDKVYIKPGLGVVKFIHALAPPSGFSITNRQVSTLVSVISY